MKWADRRITAKGIAYATQGYLEWGRVTEAPGATPKSVVGRIEAPFFVRDIYCDNFTWWLAYPPVLNDPFPAQAPLVLCQGDALEADVWLAVTHTYASILAAALGSKNQLLVDPDLGFMLRSDDGRDAERLQALLQVVRHLNVVARGIGHTHPDTRRRAGEMLQAVQVTIREISTPTIPSVGATESPAPVVEVPHAPIAPSPSTPPPSVPGSVPSVGAPALAEPVAAPSPSLDAPHDGGVEPAPGDKFDDISWGDFGADESFDLYDGELEFWSTYWAENETAFRALPVAQLCEKLGITPSFADPQMTSDVFLFGSGEGLQIGNEAGIDLFLVSADDWWVLRSVERNECDGEGESSAEDEPDEGVEEWPVCSSWLEAGEVAYLISRRLREMAYSSTGRQLHIAISATLYWAALTARAKDALWALRYRKHHDADEDVSVPSCIQQALATLLLGRYISSKHRLQIKHHYSADAHMAFDYFDKPAQE